MSKITIDRNKQQHLDVLAKKLGQAWLNSSLIDGPNPAELPENREEAYYVQDQMASVISEPLSGWKVGATSAKMRELDGHGDVIPGRIFKSVTYVSANQQLPIKRFPNARAETEFAFGYAIGSVGVYTHVDGDDHDHSTIVSTSLGIAF